jgi:uncharacterized lipoprotein YmbA
MRKILAGLFVVFSLLGCEDSSKLYLLDDVVPQERLNTVAKLVEVARLDLPEYVQANKISLRGEDGILRSSKNDLWADTPDRAMTELLALALDDGLSADVAADPWPFDQPADIKVVVKVHKLIGTQGGNLLFSGQYFLSSPIGGALAKTERFDIEVPLNDASVQMLSNAHSLAIGQLAAQISKRISQTPRSQL